MSNVRADLTVLTDAVRHLFFPRRCVLCAELRDGLSADSPLCRDCQAEWRAALSVPCPDCGQIPMRCHCIPHVHPEMLSTLTAADIRFYHLLPYVPGRRETPAARMLLRLKDRRDTDTYRFLASQLTPLCMCAVQEAYPVPEAEQRIITYTPRSRVRVRETGVDPAKELAYALSRMTGIPAAVCIDRVPGQNTAQKTLDAAGRLENAKHSYRLARHAEVRGKCVILIDDILTTGATMYAAADLLRSAGAASCICLTAAKTREIK